jgi:ABC-type multidrug transport system fused ATPase/permease subunit
VINFIFDRFNDLKFYLTRKQKIYIASLFVLTFPIGLMEIIGISSISSFILFIVQPEKIYDIFGQFNNSLIDNFINYLKENNAVIIFCIGLVVIFFIKASLTITYHYFESLLYRNINSTIAHKVFHYFLIKDHRFHKNTNPSVIINAASFEVGRSDVYLKSLLTILKELIILIFISCLCFFSDFSTSLIIFVTMFFASFFFYLQLKNILSRKGELIILYTRKFIKTLNQSLNSIKYIKIAKLEKKMSNLFRDQIDIRNLQNAHKAFISNIPRQYLEFTAIVTLVIAIIFFAKQEKEILEFLPYISLFAIAAVRLVPIFNSINLCFANLKFCEKSFLQTVAVLKDINKQKKINSKPKNITNNSNNLVELINVDFNYGKLDIFKNLNFTLKNNEKIGIYGASGSGKTTLVDIMLSLIDIEKGNVKYSKKFNFNKTAYIPQEIFLFDESIKGNIVNNLVNDKINDRKLLKSINQAELDSFLTKRSIGIEEQIGDKGIKLSGGQRQRVAIAKIFYDNSNIIFLDEATSALDNKTETRILKRLFNQKNKTIIMITHRLSSLKLCDKVYEVRNKKLYLKK